MYLKKHMDDLVGLVNTYLFKFFHESDSYCQENKNIVVAMFYSLEAGGKRIRPALCLGTAEAMGGHEKDVLPLACAIEMIHTYSLIHDDLPSMDNDSLRRGKATCHKRFDEATAILAGDALLTLAFEILADFGIKSNFLSPIKSLEIIRQISLAAGFKGMIAGQMQDVDSEGIILSRNNLKQMHVLKTGMMIKISVITSAIAMNATDDQIEKLEKYSNFLGLAYQVIDDILNISGDSYKMGKPVDTDSLLGKNTYPSICGFDESKIFANQLIDNALYALRGFDCRADFLRAIADYVVKRNI